MSAPTVILGAGCAGLSAAWRLVKRGRKVLVVEAADHVGGLAGGVHIDGNVYEYGPHIFHTTDPEILSDIKTLMGGELLPYHRTIKIRFLGNYFSFPLSVSDVLFKLPPWTVVMAGFSLLYRVAEGVLRKPEIETSETVLLRCYGDVLYKIFFKDYITRVWGIPPARFSPAFARERIPRFNLLELTDKLTAGLRRRMNFMGRQIRTENYVEKVEGELYTTRRGFSMITQRMADRLGSAGAEIRLDTRAIRLEREGDRLVSVTVRQGDKEERLACEAVVNTLPINEAALSISPGLGPAVEAAAAALRFRAIVFVGIKVRRPKVLAASFVYFREHSFNRITDLAHFDFKIEPAGCTLLVAEITCDPKDKLWSDEGLAKEAVVEDLLRERILTREEIMEMHVFRTKHGHPMYTLGYEKALAALLKAFSELRNLETAGRQGRFQYINTHVAMKMGYEAADRLSERLWGR